MKRGLLLAIVVVLVLAMAVPAALALTDTQKTELQSLYEQEQQLRQQIVDKQAEAGLITPEQSEDIKERMAEGWEFRQERMNEGDYSFGPGPGRGGRGRGYGRSRGACGNCPYYE